MEEWIKITQVQYIGQWEIRRNSIHQDNLPFIIKKKALDDWRRFFAMMMFVETDKIFFTYEETNYSDEINKTKS